MLNKKMTERLNRQINLEFYSSNLYLQMSSWAAHNGLEGCAAFLKGHAAEEMQHMQKLFDYILETGGYPLLGQIDAPKAEYKDIGEIFTITYKHEQKITQEINTLVATAFEDKDFSTFNFLQWYVAEQHEEENLFQTILDKFELLGSDPKNIYFLDKEIGQLSNSAE